MRPGHPLAVIVCLLVASACSAGDGAARGVMSSIALPPGPFHPITPAVPAFPPGQLLQTPTLFTIRTLGSRCVDAGRRSAWVLGAAVTIRDCDASEGQRILIGELDQATHDVELRVDTLCIGVRTTGRPVRGRPSPEIVLAPAVGDSVELQECNLSAAQRFALDGDAILVGTQGNGSRVNRGFVIEPRNGFTASGTPLVVGSRDLSDAEYFLIDAVDGSTTRPTSGFVTVATEGELDAALQRGWGTVIEISERAPLEIAARTIENDCDAWPWFKCAKLVHAGVTVRGNRIRQRPGGQILSRVVPDPDEKLAHDLFYIEESDVRITGLRLTGSSTSNDQGQGSIRAVRVNENARGIIIDRNEITAWTAAAIDLVGPDRSQWPTWRCPVPATPESLVRPTPVRAIRNFIHTNRGGYGLAVGTGAYALAQGNVMVQNRHAVSSDGNPMTGYRALDNFFLSQGVDFGGGFETDVDVHGSNREGSPDWYGGTAGDHFEVAFNTFLGTEQSNVYTRGDTCRFVDVHDNVTRHREPDILYFTKARTGAFGSFAGSAQFRNLEANTFDIKDPTLSTAVGDFDGDGVDDIFVGTGAGWYFSSGGRTEWRFLNRKPEKTIDLRFGDFDRDGRTDVATVHGADIVVSWAGSAEWEAINVTAGTLDDLAVGDFDGDGASDLFYANGTTWYFAPGGRNWQHFANASHRTKDLRFGRFTENDVRTNVLAIDEDQYKVVRQAGGSWDPLGPARTSSLDHVVVADFDGDGIADVGHFGFGVINGVGVFFLRVSTSGAAPLAGHSLFPVVDNAVLNGIGNFDGLPGADIVWSMQRRWHILPNGTWPALGTSWHDIR